MKNTFHLTLIDDDRNFLQVLGIALGKKFSSTAFHTKDAALKFLRGNATDGILLDVHLEGVDGFEICHEIKTLDRELPVFFMTSDPNIDLIGSGFRSGGVDYFMKSTGIEELSSRILNRLEALGADAKSANILCRGDLKIDLRSQLVFGNGREIKLTPKEYDILKIFMDCPGRLISKAQLLDLLWSDVHVDANNIDTHMYHLRKKLSGCVTSIQTRKGHGYLLRT